MCVLRARAIGVITMRDEKGQDDKIIAVHVDDPEDAHDRDVGDLPPHRLKELERFRRVSTADRPGDRIKCDQRCDPR